MRGSIASEVEHRIIPIFGTSKQITHFKTGAISSQNIDEENSVVVVPVQKFSTQKNQKMSPSISGKFPAKPSFSVDSIDPSFGGISITSKNLQQ